MQVEIALPPRPCEGLWRVGDPVSSCVTEAPEVSGGSWLRYATVGQTQNPAFGARINLILSPQDEQTLPGPEHQSPQLEAERGQVVMVCSRPQLS